MLFYPFFISLGFWTHTEQIHTNTKPVVYIYEYTAYINTVVLSELSAISSSARATIWLRLNFFPLFFL